MRVNYQLLRIARVYMYIVSPSTLTYLYTLYVCTHFTSGKYSTVQYIYLYTCIHVHVYVGFLHGNTVTHDNIAIISIFRRLPTYGKVDPVSRQVKRHIINNVGILVFYIYINVMSAFRV